MSVKVIAEAGVNHNGDIKLAYKLIDAAKKSGADAVKFQTFSASALATEDAKQCEYQSRNMQQTESQLSMLKKLELDHHSHIELQTYCKQVGIEFLSSAFDHQSLRFLVDELALKTLKIASGEITNDPFLLEHARSGCNLILSTGMSTLDEVRQALAIIAFGLIGNDDETLNYQSFEQAYGSKHGQMLLKEKVTLLHCTTEYPAPMSDINLRAIDTLKNTFGLPVGYSDHSSGIEVSTAAVAREAQVIEKHFTLDRSLPGPDHAASLLPEELTALVSAIRNVEKALGSGIKQPTSGELNNKMQVRKSLVCVKEIKQGESFNKSNIGTKRPGYGMSPMKFWQLMGRQATRDYMPGDIIRED